MLCFRVPWLELSSPSLRITRTLATRSSSGYAPSFLHANKTASKRAVPPPFARLSIPFPSSIGSALKSWVTLGSLANPAMNPRSAGLLSTFCTNLVAALFSKENRLCTEPLVSTSRARRKGSLDWGANCTTLAGGLLSSRILMLDASKSFTMCPWLLTEKNRATSSTFLRMVQTPPAPLATFRGASETAPLSPPNLGASASAKAPQSSQESDSSPNVASCAFNLSVLGKVCCACETDTVVADRELAAPAARTALLCSRAARFLRATGAKALVGSSLHGFEILQRHGGGRSHVVHIRHSLVVKRMHQLGRFQSVPVLMGSVLRIRQNRENVDVFGL